MPKPIGVVLATVPLEVAQRVDHYQAACQLTYQDAVAMLLTMATSALEARDERAHYFAQMWSDQKHREYDAALLLPARKAS